MGTDSHHGTLSINRNSSIVPGLAPRGVVCDDGKLPKMQRRIKQVLAFENLFYIVSVLLEDQVAKTLNSPLQTPLKGREYLLTGSCGNTGEEKLIFLYVGTGKGVPHSKRAWEAIDGAWISAQIYLYRGGEVKL